MRGSWLMAAFALLAAACSTTTDGKNPVSNIMEGAPLVDDDVWLLAGKYQTNDPRTSNFLPFECAGFASASTLPEQPLVARTAPTNDNINRCVEAMRNVVDKRFEHWIDVLNTSVNLGNTGIDISVIGLGAAGGLIGGTTSQIMNVVSSALTGTKGKIDSDILYNKTIPVLILQMKRDRDCWGTVIEGRIRGHTYESVPQAFNDLISYSRAGSFTEALVGIQAATGQQASDASKSLQDAKKDGADGSVAPIPVCGIAAGAARRTVSATTVLEETRIAFTSGATFAAGAVTQIQSVAAIMVKNPTLKVSIVGHADNTPPTAVNAKVAKARAEAVEAELLKSLSTVKDAKARISARGDEKAKPAERIAVITQDK